MSRTDIQHTRGLQPAVSKSTQIKEAGAAILELDTQRLKVGDGAGTVGSLEYWIDPKVRKLTAIDCGVVEGGITVGRFMAYPMAEHGLTDVTRNIEWIDSIGKFICIPKYSQDSVYLSDDGIDWVNADNNLGVGDGLTGDNGIQAIKYIKEKNLLVVFTHYGTNSASGSKTYGGFHYCHPDKTSGTLDFKKRITVFNPSTYSDYRTTDMAWCPPLECYVLVGYGGRVLLWNETPDGEYSAVKSFSTGGGQLNSVFWNGNVNEWQAFGTIGDYAMIYGADTETSSARKSDELTPNTTVFGSDDIVYAKGRYYGYLYSDKKFYSSSDGVNWQELSQIETTVTGRRLQYIEGQDLFMFNNSKDVFFSRDCVEWVNVSEALPVTNSGTLVVPTTTFAYSPVLKRMVCTRSSITSSADFPKSIITYDF